MKHYLLPIFLFLTLCSLSAQDADFYISPDGNDSNNGTIDSPFQSLEKAKEAVRSYKKKKGDIVVMLRGGEYTIAKTVVFNTKDSGKDNQRIVYTSYPGEQAILKGAKTLNGWEHPTAVESLPIHLRINLDKLWVCKEPSLKGGLWNPKTLYKGNQRLQRAQKAMRYATPFPINKAKFRPITQSDIYSGKVISSPESMVEKGIKGKSRFGKNELCAYLFFNEGDIVDRGNTQDIELMMYTRAEWMYELRGVKKLDTENGRAFFDIPTAFSTEFRVARVSHRNVSVKELPDYYAENALDYMDKYGEWCSNTTTGEIFMLSEEKPAGIEAAVVSEIIRVEGEVEGVRNATSRSSDKPVKYLEFRNITFEKADRYRWRNDDFAIHVSYDIYDAPSSLIRFRGAEDCLVDGCEFRNSGGSALRVDLYGQEIKITNNSIHDIGRSGISLIGYPLGLKDVNKKNEVANNHIYNIGQIEKNAMGIAVVQSGSNIIHNNLIHDAPFMGIAVLGHWPWMINGQKKTDQTVPTWGVTQGCNTFEKKSSRPEAVKKGEHRLYTHSRNNDIYYNEVHSVALELGDCNPLYVNTAGVGNVYRQNFVHSTAQNNHSSTGLRTDDNAYMSSFIENIVYNANGGVAVKNAGNIYNNNYFIFDEVLQDKFKGAIRIKLNKASGEELFRKTIQNNVVFFAQPAKIPNTPNNFDKHYPLIRIGTAARQDVSDLYELQSKKMDNNAVFSTVKEIVPPSCLGKNTIVADPQFKDLKNFDFTIQNKALMKELNIKQLDASIMGLSNDFPQQFRVYTTDGKEKQVRITK